MDRCSDEKDKEHESEHQQHPRSMSSQSDNYKAKHEKAMDVYIAEKNEERES